jgi:hypothetical protein
MAEKGSNPEKPKMGDGVFLLALAAGLSIRKAAKKAGISERTAYRRMANPAFRQRVTEARAAMVERSLGHLAAGTVEAAIVLRRLLRSADERVQRSAAAEILAAESRLRTEVDLAQQLADLKAELERQKQPQSPGVLPFAAGMDP